MKLLLFALLLQPIGIQAFFVDRPHGAETPPKQMMPETPPKQMMPPAATRRAAITALVVPLLLVPAAQPACAGSIIDKIDAMIAPATIEQLVRDLGPMALLYFFGILSLGIPRFIQRQRTVAYLKRINDRLHANNQARFKYLEENNMKHLIPSKVQAEQADVDVANTSVDAEEHVEEVL
jgi:hypothetical protein